MLTFLIYLAAPVGRLDDAWFQTIFEYIYGKDLFMFLTYRYYSWSTRLLLEAFTLLLIRFPLLFRLSVALWMVAIASGIDRLAGGLDRTKQWILCGAMLLIPMTPYGQVGYVCSTVNYVFTLACLLWALLPVIALLKGGKAPLWQQILSPVLMVFACNMEYYCPFALVATAVITVMSIKRKRNPVLPLLLLAVVIASTVFAFNAPVNTASAYSATGIFPGYELLNLWQKLQIGFVSTVGGSLSSYAGRSGSLLIGSLTLSVLLVLRLDKCNTWYERIVFILPLAIILAMGVTPRFFPEGSLYRSLFFESNGGGWKWDSLLTTAFAMLYTAALLWCLYRVKRWLAFGMLSAILCRVLMGFSISVFYSGMRTFAPVSVMIALCCAFLCMEKQGKKQWIVLLIGIACTLTFTSDILALPKI